MAQAILTPAATPTATDPILRCSGLRKTFRMGESTVEVLKHVDLVVRRGEFLAIEGRWRSQAGHLRSPASIHAPQARESEPLKHDPTAS